MKNIIIGTAGHIDHGKTALIKVLTGTDTDRLQEEKKRGITIDIGFAYLPLPDGERASIIDVPGHEKFVKNMLAGVGGIDMVLLVISAEEGIMPQTQEHLNILSILQIQKGIVVLTKTDLVEPEWLEMIQADVKAYVEGTFLEDAPIIPVSSHTGHNMALLKETIYQMTGDIVQKDIDAAVRIPIDRVFSADGFGTVITGTQVEGTLKVGDNLTVYPNLKPVKIKNIQMHGKSVEQSFAGQRVAINLAGVKKDELSRGDVLAKPDSMHVTMLLDIKLNLLKSLPRTLKNRTRIRFYHGTSEILGRLIILEGDELVDGESGYCQLRLENQVALKTGDHFVIRYYSPVETIGGGIILDSNPFKHKRFREDVLNELHIKELGDFHEILERIILKFSWELESLDYIAVQLGKEKADLTEPLNQLIEEGLVVPISNQVYVHVEYIETLQDQALKYLSEYHQKNPLKGGMGKEEFRSKIFKKDIGKLADAFIAYFVKVGFLVAEGNTVVLSGFKINLTDEQQTIQTQVESIYSEGKFSPPMIEEVLKSFKNTNQAKQMIQSLVERERLVKIDQNLLMHTDAYALAVDTIKNYILEKGSITLGECRDILSTSRKYALPILDHLDDRKVTRKKDDCRVLY